MTDAKQVADAYISRGGRMPGYGRDEYVNDLIDLSSFVAWAEHDGQMFGGVDAKDAFRAMCRLLDVDVIALRNTALGKGL